MEIDRCEVFGDSVVLAEGDDLNGVPRSHRRLVTTAVREVFADPRDYNRRLAGRCPFGNMAAWLRRVAADGEWVLRLHTGPPEAPSKFVGVEWKASGLRGAGVGLPDPDVPRGLPPEVLDYYGLASQLYWNGFGMGGNLCRPGDVLPITFYSFRYVGDPIDPDHSFIWGGSGCGDFLLFTADGRAGWISHEGDNYVHLLGSVGETVDWVFAELLANRDPNFDHGWVQ